MNANLCQNKTNMVSETGNQPDQFLSNSNKETAEINEVFGQNKTLLNEIVNKLLQATSNPTKAKRLEQIASQLNNLYAMGRNIDELEIDDFVQLKDPSLLNFLTEERFVNTKKILQSNDLLPLLFDNAIATFLTKNDLSLQKQAQDYLKLLSNHLDFILNANEFSKSEKVDNIKKLALDLSQNKDNFQNIENTIDGYDQSDEITEDIQNIFAKIIPIDGDRNIHQAMSLFNQLSLNRPRYELQKYEIFSGAVSDHIDALYTLALCIDKFEDARGMLGINNEKEKLEKLNRIYEILEKYKRDKENQEKLKTEKSESQNKKTSFFGRLFNGFRNAFSRQTK